MRIFCSTCKKNVTVEKREQFDSLGHVSKRVSRLQRDFGRKQREPEWQAGPAKVAA